MAKNRKQKSIGHFNFKKINMNKMKAVQAEPEKVYIPELNFAFFEDEEETAVPQTDESTTTESGEETAVTPETDSESDEEEREDAYVIVHPLTVRDKSILGSYTNQMGFSNISSECIIAGLASRDDSGRLAWGNSRHEAIEFLSEFPETFRPVITRIASKALELTGETGKNAVDLAKKN